MGGHISATLRPEEVDEMHKQTGFTPSQIERLYHRFTALDKFGNGTLCREDLLRIPELAINPLGDRIVHAFFRNSDNESINFLHFLKILAIFQPIREGKYQPYNSRADKLRFVFCLYDIDGDDLITKDELLCVLHMLVGDNISDNQLCDIADRTIKEVSHEDGDTIGFEDFCHALEHAEIEYKMSIRYLK